MATTTIINRAPKDVAIVIETSGQRRRVAVSKLPFTIGRAEDCDAVIPDSRVSRLHARLIAEGEQYFVLDADSRHGTFVNGSRCQRAPLKDNDEITLGASGLRLIFQAGEPPSSAAAVLLSKISSGSVSSELEKLTLFLEAARSLSGGIVISDVLRNVLDYALRLTKAERGFVYLRQPDHSTILACGRDDTGASISLDADVSHSVVQDAMNTAAEFVTGDTSQLSDLAGRQSIVLNELRTLIAIPLRTRREPRTVEADGVLYLDSRSVSRNLSGVSHDVLRALASECAAALESARLIEAEQAARQYRQEMEIAASIQRSLIGESEVQCEFAKAKGHSVSCKEVGGDFFDVSILQGIVTVVVVDVSGKGISAALLASVIRGMFHTQISNGTRLVDAVDAVNKFLCSRVRGLKYATLVAVQLRNDGVLQIVNCGHVPPIIFARDIATPVDEGDLPVGLMSQAGFHVIERAFPVHARLCIVTDGISESEDAQGGEFGLERLQHYLGGIDPVNDILASVQEFSGHTEAQDDRTLVVLERMK